MEGDVMRFAVAVLGLLLCYQSGQAADPGRQDRQMQSAANQAKGVFRTTEHGVFRLELSLRDNKLELGPNSLDMTVRDKPGRAVENAEIAITPWMPTMGHGVWDKPVVSVRGGGKYHVENVKIIMGGRWDLMVKIRTGALEEQVIFPFDVTESVEQAPQKGAEKQVEGYERSVTSYHVP